MDMLQETIPARSAVLRAAPVSRSCGAPESSGSISISSGEQFLPKPQPSTFATASFAAQRPAKYSGLPPFAAPQTRSCSVNILESKSCLFLISFIRSSSTISIPQRIIVSPAFPGVIISHLNDIHAYLFHKFPV